MGELRFELEYPSPHDDVEGPRVIVFDQKHLPARNEEFSQIPCLGCGEHVLVEAFEMVCGKRNVDQDTLELKCGHLIQNLEFAPTMLCVGCRLRRILEEPSA